MPPDLPGLHHEYARSDPFAWAGLVATMGVIYLAARLVTWIGLAAAFVPWSRSAGRHWTEQARLSWPGRRLAPMTWFLVPIPLLIPVIVPPLSPLHRHFGFGELLPPAVTRALFLALGYLGALQARFAWERRVNPAVALTPRSRLAEWIFLAATLAFWIWLPHAMLGRIAIDRVDLELAVVGVGLLLIAAFRFGGGLLLLRWAGLLRPAPDRLRSVLAAASERMEIRPRSVEVLGVAQANAVAFPISRRIMVTDPALAVLDDDELFATCAHELAHLGEPRRIAIVRVIYGLATLFLTALPLLFLVLVDRAFSFEGGFAIFIAIVLLWMVGTCLSLRLYHRMEIRADATARQVEVGPGTYAQALEKLYEANATPVVLTRSRGAYPELYDRMIAAGLTPDYPRPAPPPRWPYFFGLFVLGLGATAGGFGLYWLVEALA